MPATQPSTKFPAIDVLRAGAAFWVMGFHVIGLSQWNFPKNNIFLVFLSFGWMGIHLFFVISGFVIANSVLSKSNNLSSKEISSKFIYHRWWRIAPLYFLTGAVYLFVASPKILLDMPRIVLGRIASYITFTQNLTTLTHGVINGPSWSVALEVQFYVLIFLGISWLPRLRSISLFLAATFLGSSIYRYATTLKLIPGEAAVSDQFAYLTQLPGVLDQFALGIAMAILMRRGRGFWCARLVTGWQNFWLWSVSAFAVFAAAAFLFNSTDYWNSGPMLVGWRSFISLGFAALLGAAISFPWAHAKLLRPLRYAGDISYGIYLWHFVVLVACLRSVPELRGTSLLAAVAVGTALLASMTWHLLEKPAIARSRQAPSEPR